MKLLRSFFTFVIEVLFLQWEFFKIIASTFFNSLISPTEKFVRNEIVLITGSAMGLGRQLSIEFAKRGSILVLIDIDDKENGKTVELVKATGLNSKRIYAYHCNLM